MIELLVVIVILVILISVVLVASNVLITKSRVNNTRAVLQLVSDAVQEFKRERPAIVGVANLRDSDPANTPPHPVYLPRYGPYPPDELEVFTPDGIPGTRLNRTLAPGGAQVQPAPPYQAMKFYGTSDPAHDALEHRDLAAMIIAIETLTESAASMLDKIPDRNRTQGVVRRLGTTEEPAQFLDRPPTNWDSGDHQIRYITDDWGVPLGYMTQRDWMSNRTPPDRNSPSSNHGAWNHASTEIIRRNGNEPLVFSYGPDGKEQLTAEVQGADGKASLVGDFGDENANDGKVDHLMNADNVYLNDALRDRLSGEVQ